MGWLPSVGPLKLQVSFAKDPDKRDYILQRRHDFKEPTNRSHPISARPNQSFLLSKSIIFVPLQIVRFKKSILHIVQYKYLKSCSGDFILHNPILRIRSCGTSFITQSRWDFHFRLTEICLFCTTVVPASKGHLRGAIP